MLWSSKVICFSFRDGSLNVSKDQIYFRGWRAGGGYVSSARFDLKSSSVDESDENNHSDAADSFSLNDVRSSSELTFWNSSSSKKSRDR